MSRYVVLRVALTFAGSFLGAGFVSGKELSQFFLSFGISGYLGLFVAMSLLAICGIALMKFAHDSRIILFDKLVVRNEKPFFISLVGIFEIFFLIGVAVIMTAGAGALIDQLFGLSSAATSFSFCIIICLLALGGIHRMMNVFSLTVPILIISSFVVFLFSVAKFGFVPNFPEGRINTNPLTSNFAIAAVIFVSYNIFSAIGVLAPVALSVKSRRDLIIGIVIGSFFLFFIASFIFFSMAILPSSFDTELPMFFICTSLSEWFGYFYGLLLLLGMLGTSASAIVAVIEYLCNKLSFCNNKKIVCPVICIALFVLSLAGFGNLISLVYPLAGYLGIIAFAFIIEHIIYFKKSGKGIRNGNSEKDLI